VTAFTSTTCSARSGKVTKTRQVYALVGGNTAILTQMVVALIIITKLKNKTK